MRNLLVNAIRTPDGTIIQSLHRHDYVQHLDANGHTYAVDGGRDYRRRIGSIGDCAEECVYTDDNHELIRERVKWGSYGKEGTSTLHVSPVKDLSSDHIKSILGANPRGHNYLQLDPAMEKVMSDELEWRDNNDQ